MESDGRIRSMLANFVGKSPNLWLNRSVGQIDGEEMFLIGFDGLFKQPTSRDMVSCIGRIRDDSEAGQTCRRLLRLVLERGERDNVSCALIYVSVT